VGELTCDVSVRITSLEFHDERSGWRKQQKFFQNFVCPVGLALLKPMPQDAQDMSSALVMRMPQGGAAMQPVAGWMTVLLAVSLSPSDDVWNRDYGAALRACKQDGKPVLVVIGEGDSGWKNLVRESWSARSLELARQHFHCVYANASDGGYGAALARAFAVRNLPALVISDRWGQTQAVRREGAMSDAELQRLLTAHAVTESVRGSVPVSNGSTSNRTASGNAVQPASPPVILCPT
jgi:hypothetical protein